MKRILLFASALIFGTNGISQVADFETPLATAETSWHGQDATMSDTNHFNTGDFIFGNKRTVASWGSYSNGWAFSNITDNTTSGQDNQYSAFPGSGATNSAIYGICNVNGNYKVFKKNGGTFDPTSVNLTNATYTALSMQDGDAFAHEFGDPSNSAGGLDSLVLTIYALDSDTLHTNDSVNFYLADFTDGNSLIVNTWESLDLSSLGTVTGLDFKLTSSDNGQWGMNTPAYFALDNLAATNLQTASFDYSYSPYTTLSDSAWFGQDITASSQRSFLSGSFNFYNERIVADWGAYSQQWSVSNVTDNTTEGAINQYSAYTGIGAGGSAHYGICYVSGKQHIFNENHSEFAPQSMEITNSTYAALSMLNGDAFNDAFTAGDSLALITYGLNADSTHTGDSIIFYLADFTNGNSLIVNTWETIDLTPLGNVYGLDFSLVSSDNGAWGMNTPAYFAMDNLNGTNLETADFEGDVIILTPASNDLSGIESAWYGQFKTLNNTSNFVSGGYTFENKYSSASWGNYSEAWSYSNISDNTTAGSGNQYSAITGTGRTSDQYAICKTGNFVDNRLFSTDGEAFTSKGAFFTNTTYAALSIENGDAFATQFGDESNSAGGEDWFLLTVYGLNADSTRNGDSVNFYLADYRFADDSQDYIIEEWTWVDLTSLENIYGLDFELSSSDVSQWGMNTPSYFAMDKFDIDMTSVYEIETETISAYPNPTNGLININATENSTIKIFDINGKLVFSEIASNNTTLINMTHFENGVYILSVENNGIAKNKKIVKK